jgi:hypothetical protein
MSAAYTRWSAYLYYSDTDVAGYDSLGQVNKTTLDSALVPYVQLYITQSGYGFAPTNELALDISGRPYSKKRGFTDGWTLATTPYYYDSSEYFTIADLTFVATAIKKRHLWIYFEGPAPLATIVDANKAVKVVFESWSETLNNASGSRTAEIKFQRKYRADAI